VCPGLYLWRVCFVKVSISVRVCLLRHICVFSPLRVLLVCVCVRVCAFAFFLVFSCEIDWLKGFYAFDRLCLCEWLRTKPSKCMALRCVAHFLESEEVAVIDEFESVCAEEKLYSGHRAFVLATYVDSQMWNHGSVHLDMLDTDSLLLNLDAVKTPLADAWRLAGRHRLVYRLVDDLCPTITSWFDTLRYGDSVDR